VQACENVLALRLGLKAQERSRHIFRDGQIPAPFLPLQAAAKFDRAPESTCNSFFAEVYAIPLQSNQLTATWVGEPAEFVAAVLVPAQV